MKKTFINQDLVDLRLQGQLPKIKISDRSFIIDWRLKELRAVDNPGHSISMKHLPLTPDGESYYFFLHEPSLRLVSIGENITRLPKDVVLVEIPNELKLDPIGVAREFGLQDTEMLATFPIQRDLTAKVTPLQDTALADLALKNKEKTGLKAFIKKLKPKTKGKGFRR